MKLFSYDFLCRVQVYLFSLHLNKAEAMAVCIAVVTGHIKLDCHLVVEEVTKGC